MLPSLDDYLHVNEINYHLTFFWDIDQRIPQYDLTRSTIGHTQWKVVVSDEIFTWGLTLCKIILKISLDSFQRYWSSKNPALWLDKRHTWPHPTKSSSLPDPTFGWWLSSSTKSKVSIDSIQRYWWSNNTAIRLVESI